MRLRSKQVGHESDYEGLRDGLIEADRQRHVLIGICRHQIRHEEMPRHPPHHGHHPLIELRLAELFAGKIDVNFNHLDHVPAQNREVLFVHWLHDSGALRSAGQSILSGLTQ